MCLFFLYCFSLLISVELGCHSWVTPQRGRASKNSVFPKNIFCIPFVPLRDYCVHCKSYKKPCNKKICNFYFIKVFWCCLTMGISRSFFFYYLSGTPLEIPKDFEKCLWVNHLQWVICNVATALFLLQTPVYNLASYSVQHSALTSSGSP